MSRLLLQGGSSQDLSQSSRTSLGVCLGWEGQTESCSFYDGGPSSLKSEPNHPFSAGNNLAEGQAPYLLERFL